MSVKNSVLEFFGFRKKKVSKPVPQPWLTEFVADPEIDFQFGVSDPTILKLAGYQSFLLTNEIAMYGHVSPSKSIQHMGKHLLREVNLVAVGIPNYVTTDPVNSTAAMLEMLERGKKPNTQIHTHPCFDAYWSLTDMTAQYGTVTDAKKIFPEGEYYFVVVGWNGGFHALGRKYVWDDHGIFYKDSLFTMEPDFSEAEEGIVFVAAVDEEAVEDDE